MFVLTKSARAVPSLPIISNLKTDKKFTNFLGSFQIFLASAIRYMVGCY